MAVDTREFLAKQRRRAVGGILGHVEHSPWYQRLTKADTDALRTKVIESVGAYHDCVLDLVSALDGGGGVVNDRALALLEELHTQMVRQERPLVAQDATG